MLIILPEPIHIGNYHIMVLIMDNYHRITIRHFPDFVGLTLDQSLVPEHDGFFVIAKYRTHSEAIEGFRQLVQAYDQGERVYAGPVNFVVAF